MISCTYLKKCRRVVTRPPETGSFRDALTFLFAVSLIQFAFSTTALSAASANAVSQIDLSDKLRQEKVNRLRVRTIDDSLDVRTVYNGSVRKINFPLTIHSSADLIDFYGSNGNWVGYVSLQFDSGNEIQKSVVRIGRNELVSDRSRRRALLRRIRERKEWTYSRRYEETNRRRKNLKSIRFKFQNYTRGTVHGIGTGPNGKFQRFMSSGFRSQSFTIQVPNGTNIKFFDIYVNGDWVGVVKKNLFANGRSDVEITENNINASRDARSELLGHLREEYEQQKTSTGEKTTGDCDCKSGSTDGASSGQSSFTTTGESRSGSEYELDDTVEKVQLKLSPDLLPRRQEYIVRALTNNRVLAVSYLTQDNMRVPTDSKEIPTTLELIDRSGQLHARLKILSTQLDKTQKNRSRKFVLPVDRTNTERIRIESNARIPVFFDERQSELTRLDTFRYVSRDENNEFKFKVKFKNLPRRDRYNLKFYARVNGERKVTRRLDDRTHPFTLTFNSLPDMIAVEDAAGETLGRVMFEYERLPGDVQILGPHSETEYEFYYPGS